MQLLDVNVKVTKEMHELCDAAAGLIESIKEKAKDGLSAAEIATAVTENIGRLMTGIAGAEQIPAEAKANPREFTNASFLLGSRVVGAFLPQDAQG